MAAQDYEVICIDISLTPFELGVLESIRLTAGIDADEVLSSLIHKYLSTVVFDSEGIYL